MFLKMNNVILCDGVTLPALFPLYKYNDNYTDQQITREPYSEKQNNVP